MEEKKAIRIKHRNMLDLFLSIIKEHENMCVCEGTNMSLNFSPNEGFTLWEYTSGNHHFVNYKDMGAIEGLYDARLLDQSNIDSFVEKNKDLIIKMDKLKSFI